MICSSFPGPLNLSRRLIRYDSSTLRILLWPGRGSVRQRRANQRLNRRLADTSRVERGQVGSISAGAHRFLLKAFRKGSVEALPTPSIRGRPPGCEFRWALKE